MSGPLPLSLGDLALAAALILVNGGLSLWLKLGLERRLMVATVRSVVQLLLLGLVLMPIFEAHNLWFVLALCAVMLVLASRAAVARTSYRYRGVLTSSFVAVVAGAVPAVLLGAFGSLGVEPWWEPQYLIPLLGMMLGNSLTGVSLGLDRAMAELDTGRDRVDARLALGASGFEAARPVASEALRTGMIPILNAMTVAGLVTIPGMMTGQILGGTPPELAARYQVMIMFLIAGSTGIGTATAVLATLRLAFDDQHRLRADFLRRI